MQKWCRCSQGVHECSGQLHSWSHDPATLYVSAHICATISALFPAARRFAQSQRLLTPPRLAFGTLSTIAVVALALPPAQALAVGAIVLAMTVASAYYGHAVLGGVVGDYLGATIAATELAIYLVLTADWAAVAVRWQPLAVLAAAAAVPIIYTRRIIKIGGASC